MNKYNEGSFTVQKKLLTFCGLNPSRNVYYKLYSFLVISLLWSYSIGLIPSFIQNETYDSLLENSPFFIAATTVSFFYALLHVNKNGMYSLMDKLETGVFLPNMARGGTFEEDLLMKCVKVCKKVGICSIIFASFPTPFTLLVVIGSEEEILPFGNFPLYGTLLNYKMKVIIQFVIYVIVPTGYCAVILMYITILFHILTHFKILQNALKHMEKTCKNLEPETKWNSQLHCLREVIYYHNSIIEVAAELESLFNISVLLVFIGSVVFIIFAASYGSLDAFLTFGYIRDALLLTATGFHITILSYIGNEVTLESEKVGVACSEINYVGENLKFQKAIILIIERSQRPIRPTIGKLADLSLLTFVSILRGMVSYIIVLRSFRNSGVRGE
ncbi:hypothetical protein RI129_001768 [Pyrocoelia pectoralis]|uniref:Odorant receptor n=1 Tax=Pyrocoelia pectoralis TaxID=417401 RepID=A0AAN7VVA4_9COLE